MTVHVIVKFEGGSIRSHYFTERLIVIAVLINQFFKKMTHLQTSIDSYQKFAVG